MNGEILRLVDTIHRDKEIEKEIIFQGIEAALLSAVKKKLGESEATRVVIDRETGEVKVLEGDEEITVEDLGRIAAMTGKQVLFQKIREAERDRIYQEYSDKVGKLVSGVVQRIEGPNLIVNLGKVEGILPRSEQAPGEKFKVGERIKVLVKEIRKNTNRVKITLSRTSTDLVRALFELEVPEIADKVIEIMEIAREPGYRTKIAVTTYDHNVDCVGACVGVRGSRIKNIVDELFGEKIDIVRWNESIEVLIMNALKPAEISSMDLDFEARKALVYVKPDQQSLAIGKRGQNVRLASKLSKWDLDIVTVSDADLEKLRREELPQDSSPLSAAGIFPDRAAPVFPDQTAPVFPDETAPVFPDETAPVFPDETAPVFPDETAPAVEEEAEQSAAPDFVGPEEEEVKAPAGPVPEGEGLEIEEPGESAAESGGEPEAGSDGDEEDASAAKSGGGNLDARKRRSVAAPGAPARPEEAASAEGATASMTAESEAAGDVGVAGGREEGEQDPETRG
jgi:N utilization substance protein A